MYVRSFARWFGSLVVLAGISSGCDCGGGQVSTAYGELGVVYRDEAGKVVTSRDAVYDFGTVPMGERFSQKLVVQNLGTGPLTVISLERVEGDAVTIGTEVQDRAAFDVRFVPDTQVDASGAADFEMIFTPPHAPDASQTEVAHSVKLVLATAGARPGDETATILLRGTATAASCELPQVIDFGKVALGDTDQKPLTLSNTSLVETVALIGDIVSATGDHQAFGVDPKGELPLGAGQTRDVLFDFAPTEVRAYEAKVKVRAGTVCGETELTLRGEGADSVLEWAPTTLDFLYVPRGNSSTRTVTFTNHGASDVTVSNLATSLPADFAVKAPEGSTDATRLVVPGGGQAQLSVVCRPSQDGRRNAQLTFQTPLTKQPNGTVQLTCFGGGPDIKIIPETVLNFGKTAYFENTATPYSVTRRVTVMNVGSAAPGGDPNGNLRLGKVSEEGVPGQLPFVAVRPLNAQTTASELSVGIPPTYNAAVGLLATAGSNLMDLTVTFTPKSLGQKQAELLIYSNDSDEPETKLLITADVVQMPPCNYSVSPAQVSFGLVTPGTFREVPVTFTNLGVNPGEVCLISGVDLMPGTDPSYKMPNGAIASRELAPGDALQVLVRVEPTGQVPNSMVSLSGTLQYFASSPTAPRGTVPLQTSVGPSCVTIAPSHQDFGAAKPGCSAGARTFTLYNVCPQTVTLSKLQMQDAAGQAAGGPNCPGTSACPEFIFSQTPAIGAGLAMPPGGTPVTFQAKYKPLDLGPDSGVIAVSIIQSGTTVNYLVTLAGEGDTNGQQTDTFVQDQQPKADVLLTIDSSGSMQNFQTSLANNFASFIQYAQSANVDWQIGVTTTDMDDANLLYPAGPKGKLLGDANNPKILTPTTPDVVNKFKAKVNVGTNGSGIEKGLQPSLLAVTPPLSVAENAGFLRPDANLAIVVVTDAPDHSPQPYSFYLNSLLNVKGFHKANMFTFNAIAGFSPTPPTSCVYDEAPDDGSYASVVTQTNGIKEEICTQNWSAALQGLGKTAFGFRTTFFLTSVPDASKPITVTLNGTVMPKSGSTGATNWTYDAVSNAITFAQTAAPGPGETLEISYFVGCLP